MNAYASGRRESITFVGLWMPPATAGRGHNIYGKNYRMLSLDVDSRKLPDGWYLLLVTAYASNGDSNTVRFEHLIDNTGHSLADVKSDQPLQVWPNYPNPFNTSTTIIYSLSFPGRITLKVFNLLGQQVATLVDEPQPSGVHTVVWHPRQLPAGIYFYRLSVILLPEGSRADADAFASNSVSSSAMVITRKMILVK